MRSWAGKADGIYNAVHDGWPLHGPSRDGSEDRLQECLSFRLVGKEAVFDLYELGA